MFFFLFSFFVVTRRPSAKRRFSQCCCRALHQSFLLLSDDPPRTLFGDHYYFPRAGRSQICVGANSFLLVAGAKKISRQCGFWPKFISWRPGIFSPTPLSDTQETKLGARNCAQTVRKLCAEFENSPNRDSISCEFERLKNELKNGSFQAGNRVFFAVFCRARKTVVF